MKANRLNKAQWEQVLKTLLHIRELYEHFLELWYTLRKNPQELGVNHP